MEKLQRAALQKLGTVLRASGSGLEHHIPMNEAYAEVKHHDDCLEYAPRVYCSFLKKLVKKETFQQGPVLGLLLFLSTQMWKLFVDS